MELNNLNDAWDSFMINDDNDDMMNSDENKSYFEEVVEKSVSSKSDEIKIPNVVIYIFQQNKKLLI